MFAIFFNLKICGVKFEINEKCLMFTGHSQHEMTSYCAMSSIFRFLRQKLEAASAGAEQPEDGKLIDQPDSSPPSNELWFFYFAVL